jgi:hypothetical protein
MGKGVLHPAEDARAMLVIVAETWAVGVAVSTMTMTMTMVVIVIMLLVPVLMHPLLTSNE